MKLNIIEQYYTNNPCLRAGGTCRKIGIQIHTPGCAQASADKLRNSMNNLSYMAGVHYLIDAENPWKVLQTMPENIRSWADGGYGNDNLISMEICESNYMEYIGGASFRITNQEKFKTQVLIAYNTAVLLCAKICKERGWNPTDKLPSGLHLISSHDEGRRAGLSTAHVDPSHVWPKIGKDMDTFRAEVKVAMKGITADTEFTAEPTPEIPTGIIYWKVQCGAYREKANADKLCTELQKKGFQAFVVRVGRYYKVQIGAYTAEANARKLLEKVKSVGYPAFITRSSSGTTYNTWVGCVTADKLNVRTGASADCPNLQEWPLLSKGNLIDIIGESGDWYQIKIAGQYKGWASKKYIQKV